MNNLKNLILLGGMVIAFILIFGWGANFENDNQKALVSGNAKAVARAHNGANSVTVNVNEPAFFYAKDSVGGASYSYKGVSDFEWDFDSSNGVNYGDSISSFTYHKYTSPGTYTVTLKITDDQGAVDTDTVIVNVQNIPTGDTFYVSKSGDDSNGCTNNTTDACLTINSALSKTTVGAGDTIVVGAGSYNEAITFRKGGTENRPITIKAANGTKPEIYYTSNGHIIDFNGYDYITIDGFEIDGRSSADSISIPNTSEHISIRNSEIHHIDSSNLGAAKKNNGLTISPDRSSDHKNAKALWTYIYNTNIHNNAPSNVNVSSWGNVFENVIVKDPGLNGEGEDNYVLNSAGHGNYFKGGENGRTKIAQDAHQDGWELYGASNVTIEGMKIYNSEAELIMCDAAIRPSTDMCDNLVFVNNVVYRSYSGTNADQQQLKLRCGYNFKVVNNTFYGRLSPIVLDTCRNSAGASDNGLSANNIFMGSGNYNCSNTYGSYSVTKTNNSYYNCSVSSGESNVKQIDPQLVNPVANSSGNFALKSTSPLKDSGTNTGYPKDILGTKRVSYDIGAYEIAGDTVDVSYQCSDNIDNDGDGLTDYPLDPGCTSSTDNDEYNAPIETCSDGIKNQNETGVDCGGVCPVCIVNPTCGNGIIEAGEECEGSNFEGKSCSSYGFDSGSLTCSSCSISTTNCQNLISFTQAELDYVLGYLSSKSVSQSSIDQVNVVLTAEINGNNDGGDGGEVTPPPSDSNCFIFMRDLKQGDHSNDVVKLQEVLNRNSVTQVAVSGPGSPGYETDFFGKMTKYAVIKFQDLYAFEILHPLGLTEGTGYVGETTRTKLNSMCP